MLDNKTPYDMIYGHALDFDALSIRLSVYVFLIIKRRKEIYKFSLRSRKCILVGYLTGKKGWKLYELGKRGGDIFVFWDVKFFLDYFPLCYLIYSHLY